MSYGEWMEAIGKAVDALGVAVIVLGIVTVSFLAVTRRHVPGLFRLYRQRVGRSILLGLEFLVAGDIIRTVAVEPTFESVGILAGIVAIRTFLSFTLEVEVSGRWPWQQQAKDDERA